ncbi:hypothetical protein ZEAMMB73_Zm00001d038758 [Zea mays]|uniref:Knottins-like domain-containing protein n=1 Tax=Zea mays TaxID=4577 RepID=A0A1D6MAC5_MAIZE|nr:hypothetical protein ZEAMMB73_Zm00001d038758 [Zea mays]
METSRRSHYAGGVVVVLLLLVVVVTGREFNSNSTDDSKLPPCYHWSRDFKGTCLGDKICTNVCLHQDPYNFIRGKCRGFPAGKCFCLSC